MNKKYNILNLDCGHCAMKLENAINELDCVNSCSINFATSTMILDFNKEELFVLNQVKQVILKTEPEVKIEEIKKSDNSKKTSFLDISTFIFFGLGIIGAVLLRVLDFPTVWHWIILISSALIIGYKTYYKAIFLLFKGTINENLLVTISVIGACAIGEHDEALMVIILYTLGKILESYAVNKTRNSIKTLMQMQPEYAILINEDKEEKVDPDSVKIGSTIVVRPGERVPLDGKIIEGEGSLDIKNLTGESIPKYVKKEDNILSGSILIDGLLFIKTTGTYKDSTVVRIMNLIEEATDKKSKTETFISKFAKWYTLIVVSASVLVFGLTWAILKDYSVAVYRGLIFLVVSCPCAFAISVPLAYFSGLGNASKYGILIKGSNYLDNILNVKTFVFDKTGTLTTGMFGVDKIISNSKYTEQELLHIAMIGEQFSIHPIAKAIMHFGKGLNTEKCNNFKEVAGKGISYEFNNNYYQIYTSTTNAHSNAVDILENGNVIGSILLSDKIKPESKETIAYLKKHKIKTVMLSGDNQTVTTDVANKLEVDEYHYNMLPTDKYQWLKNTKENVSEKTKVAFVGDGINDAPSLSFADVGISMGLAGSPATVEASDIVIVDDNIEKIEKCLKISKFNKKIVIQNIVFASVFKVAFLLLGSFGITGMATAVFADVGVTLLATLNSLRSLYHKV